MLVFQANHGPGVVFAWALRGWRRFGAPLRIALERLVDHGVGQRAGVGEMLLEITVEVLLYLSRVERRQEGG